VRIYVQNLFLILCFIILLHFTLPPVCSLSNNPLTMAIEKNKRDVVALLRSVGARAIKWGVLHE